MNQLERAKQNKILIIEDEVRIIRTLRLYLEHAGFEVVSTQDGNQAMAAFRKERPLLILLDLNLPNLDGLDVFRVLRQGSNVPIIMLTARIEEADRLVGLELGADDYITKPFSPREVVARVKNVLRRASNQKEPSDTLRVGNLLIDIAGHRAWMGAELLSLTQYEFDILQTLVRHKGWVLSRLQLLEATHGVAYDSFERTIDQHIKNLRRKLKPHADELIQTVYGVGYRLDEENQ